MMHGQAISDNEIYLLIKYVKSFLWRVVKCLSYIEEARCLKVKAILFYFNLITIRACVTTITTQLLSLQPEHTIITFTANFNTSGDFSSRPYTVLPSLSFPGDIRQRMPQL